MARASVSVPQLINNLFVGCVPYFYYLYSYRVCVAYPDKAQEVLATAHEVADNTDAFADLDYIFSWSGILRQSYLRLDLNGMKGYTPALVATISPIRKRAVWHWVFYHKLSSLCERGARPVYETVRRCGRRQRRDLASDVHPAI